MKKYISIITAIVLVASIGSCKKGYLDLEANPNNPSQTTPQLILAGALVTVPNITVGTYLNPYDVWGGYLSWNGGVVPPATLFEYTFNNATYQGIWSTLYANATNFNNLIAMSAKDPSLAHFQAIGMIMKAWDFEQLVDNFGDVPYSQAFQPSTILFPKYDKATDIYTDLYKQLSAAITLAGQSGTSPGASDPMFNGDMSLWIQTAQTLKLRLAVREAQNAKSSIPSGALPLTADTYSDQAKAYTGSFLTTDALINPGYLNSAGQQNPFYGNFVKDATGNPAVNANIYRANAYAIKFLKDHTDTLRLAQIFSLCIPAGHPSTEKPSIYYGNVYGDNVNIKGTANVSGAGPGLGINATQSSLFISASESYLLQAEAVQLGLISGSAANLYKAGIEANFVYLGLTADQADVYVGAHPFGGINDILTQKYITYMNGYDSFEAFNDYREFGFPALPSSVDPAALSTHLPTRLYYPLTEQQTNLNNYNAAGGPSINPFTSKIFWAK